MRRGLWAIALLLGCGMALPSFAQPETPPKPAQKPGAAKKPTSKKKWVCSAYLVGKMAPKPAKAPNNVRWMHQQIVAAAGDCNFAQLERLALQGRPNFDFTFGTEKKPGDYWKKRETQGDKFMATLIRILRLPYGRDGKVYVWPAAWAKSANEDDWEALVPLFGHNQMVTFRDYGGYTGLRLAIHEDGDWLYCLDGD